MTFTIVFIRKIKSSILKSVKDKYTTQQKRSPKFITITITISFGRLPRGFNSSDAFEFWNILEKGLFLYGPCKVLEYRDS